MTVAPLLSETSTPTMAMRPYDTALMAVVLVLIGIGVVMVYSSSVYVAEAMLNNGAHYLHRQLVNATVGLVAMMFGLTLPYRKLRDWVYPLLALSLVLLLLLLIPGVGTTVGRSTRWFRLPFFSFQPSELAKLAFIVWLAYSLEKKNTRMKSFTVGFLPHLLCCGLIMVLCLAQPDFGTCLVLASLMVLMLFIAGTKVSYIALLFFAAVPIVVKVIAGNSMRMQRILAFLDPWEHRYDVGYQAVNSLAAMGSGGLWGLGLGESRQKIGYIPEAQTDFILPIVGEELGFVGIAAILLMFAFVVFRGVIIAWRAKDDFGRYLAFGITMLIGIQAIVNTGVSMSLLPTKGLTLPFISFGG
ncbi:MAG: putative lipid II flippase FtsW, partial [Myxococcales bacterium]|nr:putative lipid II flippase FtsW [Myxococcales bacterium]